MRLTILGRCGGYAGVGGACAAHLVDAGSDRLLFDVGYGVVARLLEHGPARSLSGIVLTHLHPDHVAEIPALQLALEYESYPPDKWMGRIPTFGPAGAYAHLAQFAPTPNEREHMMAFFDLQEIDPTRSVSLAGFSLRFAPGRHIVDTYGVRVTRGRRSLVYTSDTAQSTAIDDLAKGADVLLAEATFPERLRSVAASFSHLTGVTAGQLAARAEVGRLLLTHFFPGTNRDEQVAAAREVFAGPVEAVSDGAVYEI